MTSAEADAVGSAWDVAVTVANCGVGTREGAVYRPPDVTAPQALPAHPYPETLQITAVFVVPVTVALNCCCAPVFTVALAGEMLIDTVGRPVTVTVAEPETDGLDSKVAVTVTVG